MAKQSTPKTMSSRLMTMKFMQRGAAVAAAAAAGAPEASSPATPQSAGSGSAKRRKLSHTPSAASSPATPLYDQQHAILAVTDEEEKRRQAAVERRAAELGDSHWVLEGVASLPPRASRPLLNVVQVGFAQIDHPGDGAPSADDDPFDFGSMPAQPQFRRFNMKKSKACLLGRGNDCGVLGHADTVYRRPSQRTMKTKTTATLVLGPVPSRERPRKMSALRGQPGKNPPVVGGTRSAMRTASAPDPACRVDEKKSGRRRSSLPGRDGRKRSG